MTHPQSPVNARGIPRTPTDSSASAEDKAALDHTSVNPRKPRSTHRWLALGILAIAQFLVVLDASIVNIALPSVGSHLHLDTAALAWVITAYVLPFGGLLLLGGRLGDRFGHRRVFLAGTTGFIAASAAAGFSTAAWMLLTARVVQGASAALLAPAALALVTHVFQDQRSRSKALGVWGAVAGIGAAAGVLLGGVLTAAYGWQAVFFVNVPVGAFVLVAIPALISRDRSAGTTRLDLPGAVTVTAALVAFVAAFTSAGQTGFTSATTLGLLAAGIVLIVTFVFIERRSVSPLVPLSIFRAGSVTAGNIAMVLGGATIVALFFALSVYMQEVLHYDALTAGLSQLPLAGALILAAALVPSVIARVGLRVSAAAAFVMLAAGLVWLASAGSHAVFTPDILGPTLLIGISLGGAFVTTTQLAVEGVPTTESGLAGGLVNSSQQVGGALGLAILSSIAAFRTGSLESAGAPAADALTAGFAWLYLSAAVFVVIAAVVVLVLKTRSR